MSNEKVYFELNDIPVKRTHPSEVKVGDEFIYFTNGYVLNGVRMVKCSCKVRNISYTFKPPFTHQVKFYLMNDESFEASYEEGSNNKNDSVLIRHYKRGRA